MSNGDPFPAARTVADARSMEQVERLQAAIALRDRRIERLKVACRAGMQALRDAQRASKSVAAALDELETAVEDL